MPQLWTPGMAGPLDELVERIHRRVREFADEHGVEAMVEAELMDGSLHRLRTISADPGFGFVTLCPHGEAEPRVLIVPIGAIRQLTIAEAEPERHVGFTVPAEGT